jgi:hypothetical protein
MSPLGGQKRGAVTAHFRFVPAITWKLHSVSTLVPVRQQTLMPLWNSSRLLPHRCRSPYCAGRTRRAASAIVFSTPPQIEERPWTGRILARRMIADDRAPGSADRGVPTISRCLGSGRSNRDQESSNLVPRLVRAGLIGFSRDRCVSVGISRRDTEHYKLGGMPAGACSSRWRVVSR